MRTLEDMEAAAQRQLDGMTVNRDSMARDVLFLVALVRRLQVSRQTPEAKKGADLDWLYEVMKMGR